MKARWPLVAVALALLAGSFWVLWLGPTRHAVAIGAGMLAKQMCSCVFVARRDPDACRADQFASMDAIELDIARDAKTVRAFVPLLGERSAAFSEEFGCTLQ